MCPKDKKVITWRVNVNNLQFINKYDHVPIRHSSKVCCSLYQWVNITTFDVIVIVHTNIFAIQFLTLWIHRALLNVQYSLIYAPVN